MNPISVSPFPRQKTPPVAVRPTLSVPRFGMRSYRDILSLDPPVRLTARQERVLKGFEAMAAAKDLSELSRFLRLLNTPEYGHLHHSMHRGKPQTMRHRFHSPFTDLMLNLAENPKAQRQLMQALAGVIREPAGPQALINAIEALNDVYFYVFRPGGQAFLPENEARHGYALGHQVALAKLFRELLTDHALPVKTRRLLQNELICSQYDMIRKDWPVVKPEPTPEELIHMKHQLDPLLYMPLPAYPPLSQPVPVEAAQALRQAIERGDVPGLMRAMKHPRLKALIPDWERAFGKHRHQQADHDYPLGEHVLEVFKSLRNSRFYTGLNEAEKFRVATAAVFHDIAKRTGPANLREGQRIMFDIHHPWRSGETAQEILPELGYTREETADIVNLIQWHQNLGNFASPYAKPGPVRLQEVAKRVGTESRVAMLMALTEADIASVKRPEASWLTPEAQSRLDGFYEKIKTLIAQMRLAH